LASIPGPSLGVTKCPRPAPGAEVGVVPKTRRSAGRANRQQRPLADGGGVRLHPLGVSSVDHTCIPALSKRSSAPSSTSVTVSIPRSGRRGKASLGAQSSAISRNGSLKVGFSPPMRRWARCPARRLASNSGFAIRATSRDFDGVTASLVKGKRWPSLEKPAKFIPS
jgi:hypothetical protein